MKLKTRLTAAILIIAVLPLLLMSLVQYASYRSDLLRSVHQHLESAAATRSARVAAVLDRNAERLALVASRTQLRLSLARHLQVPDPGAQARMNRILADANLSIAGLEQITVYDLAGQAVASTAPARIGESYPRPALFARAREQACVDAITLDAAGHPRLTLAGPMVLDGTRLGVVVLSARMTSLIEAVTDTAGLGATGETILSRRAETPGTSVFLAPTRLLPDATLQTFPTLGAPPRRGAAGPADGAGREPAGLIRGRDYRGKVVLARAHPVPGTDWTVTVKIDREEALANVDRAVLWGLGLLVGLTAVILVATLRFSRHLSRPLEELAGAADGIARGDYSHQVPVRSADEVGLLARGFNSMASRVATAHAGLQENVRELQQEIQRRRRVESEREALIAELTQAMAEIRTLEGIIPICASCKKIRDDHGYWNQLETYLAEHSQAHFSHGLCPDCLARYEQDMDLGHRELDPADGAGAPPDADPHRPAAGAPPDASDPPPDPRWPQA